MVDSFGKNKKGIIIMFMSAIFVCFGQLFWKLYFEYGLMYLFFGFIVYGIGAVLMITAYRFGSLSVLQPILAVNYVLSVFLSVVVLNEALNFAKIGGIIIITVGVIFVGSGEN